MSTLYLQEVDMQAYCYGSDGAISIQRPKRPDKEGEEIQGKSNNNKDGRNNNSPNTRCC